jgi:hypothetical protein
VAGVCFKSEHRGWMQDQWSWVFSNFGITEIWERDWEGSTDADIYQSVIRIDTAAELPSKRPLIILSGLESRYIKGDQSLDDFVHPEDAIYLFGGSHENLSDEDDLGGRVPDALVYIPTVDLECYGHSAAYMTLRDRYVKRGNRFG